MKILFVTKDGNANVLVTDILPRIGDKVCMFYEPWPMVKTVLLYPNKEYLSKFKIEESIDVIITVD
jgi:hypothetical protein